MISARNIKRVIRRWCVWRQTLPRLEREYRPIVERMLGGTVTWQQAGGRGRDVIVLVKLGGSPSAFLRLVAAPDKTIKPHAPGLPFVALDAAAKLEREWHAYAQAAPLGLAPTPLWRDQHAMLSAYVDGTPLTQAARRRGGAALSATLAAMPAIAALHATGLTHMDMSLANILRRRDDGKLLFIDFEHGAAAGLSHEQQCLYDYLRLYESVWKFLSPDERARAAASWDTALRQHVPPLVRTAELTPLRPALTRILAAPELRGLWQSLVP